QEVPEAEENSGMKGRDKHGEQQRQRIELQQDTQAVGRSGCFLLHSDSVVWMAIFVPRGCRSPTNSQRWKPPILSKLICAPVLSRPFSTFRAREHIVPAGR